MPSRSYMKIFKNISFALCLDFVPSPMIDTSLSLSLEYLQD
jgi:hypothetical protein